MRKHKIIAFFILILLSINVICVSCAYYDNSTPYYNLFQIELELFQFSTIYENESMPSFDFYNQALENASKYPLYSYNLLLDCYRAILLYNLTKRIKMMGNKTVVETFILEVQDTLSNITKIVNNVVPKTLASLEWLDLAKREIISATDYFSQADGYYTNKDYNLTIASLILADSSLHKAHGFIYLANKRNIENAVFVNTSKLLKTVKYVASNWITHVESAISFYENIGYEQYLSYPKLILNQSKDYFSKELYYVAIMNAASAEALVDYYTHRYLTHSNQSEILTVCKTHFNYAELTMNQIYDDNDIDAPFAESTIELAKLHLEDAGKEENESSAGAIAGISIQESLIAQKQAWAALDLKNAIKQELNEDDTCEEASQTNTMEIQYIMLTIIAIEFLLLVILWLKRK